MKILKKNFFYFKNLIKRNKKFYNYIGKSIVKLKEFNMFFKLLFSDVKYLKPLELKKKYKSQYGQDYYLEQLGLIKRNNFYIEVGSNHPIINSNSFYLEKYLNCRGISIDAIDFSLEYKKYRPNAKFIHGLVDKKKGYRKFYHTYDLTGWENQLSSVTTKMIRNVPNLKYRVKKIKTFPLKEILNKKKINLLMIDVEGYELNVIKSINLKKCMPEVILIENNGHFFPRKKLQDYMINNGYKLYARIGITDDLYIKENQ